MSGRCECVGVLCGVPAREDARDPEHCHVDEVGLDLFHRGSLLLSRLDLLDYVRDLVARLVSVRVRVKDRARSRDLVAHLVGG